MFREQSRHIERIHRLLDILLTVAAFGAAYFIKRDLLPEPFRGLITAPHYHVVLLLIIIIWYVIFKFFGFYTSFRGQKFRKIFWNMIKAVFISFLLLSFLMYLLKITHVSRMMMAIFLTLNILFLGISKGVVYKVLAHFRGKGFNFRNILIVGSREGAKEIIGAIGDRLDAGYRILGCLEVDERRVGETVENGVRGYRHGRIHGNDSIERSCG